MAVKVNDRAKVAETAEKYVKSGKLAAAIAEYEKLLDGGAHDIPIGNIIGDLHVQVGDEDKAIRIFAANIKALDRRGVYSQALAIAKKIQKIRPQDHENIIRLGDLYSHLGFMAEARTEYLRAAEELERRGDLGPLLGLYEKLARIDRSDFAVRLKLARLYIQKSQPGQAVEELNGVADLLYVRNDLGEAEKILTEALALQDDNVRTMSNLVRVLAKSGKRRDAIALVERSISRRGESAEFLAILANLHLEAGNVDRAAEIFGRILEDDPQNADARAKLGWIEIRRGRLDEAYALYEPLIFNLINKNKEDKAVGLLGLILMSGTMHPPALERLGTIFRIGGRRPELEVVDRVLLAEYRRRRLDEDRARVIKELMELSPFDPEVEREFRAFHWEAKVFEEKDEAAPAPAVATPPQTAESAPVAPALNEEDRDIVRLNLAKADFYASQGMVRNARRILDNLLLLYPAEPRIVAKCEELQAQRPATGDDEIAQVIERIAAGAAPPDSEDAASADRVLPVFDLGSKAVAREKDGKVSAADLFAGIDLVPFVAPEEPPPAGAFLDLDDKIAEEIEAIGAVFARQFQDRASVIEKDLTDIVQDFRRQVEAKLDKQNTETRQSLGQAFLEQGLYDEAIEEFKLAAADPERAADCAGLIARALVKKGLPAEAEVWLRQGRDKTSPGSTEYFALTYDLAQLLETLDRNADALALFKEVSGWNAKFRDVGKRIRILQKTVSA